MTVKIYHNPRCTKSRQTLALLQERGIKPQIIEYLQTPPSVKELEEILQMLGMNPRDLMRKSESLYKDQELDRERLTHGELVHAMVRSPVLIERPIVVANGKAAIGRPPEKVLAIL
ncbi:MAG: arsenate reductase (glutaredoxin) [Alphaproteobacteria bacterium]|nr:arsenate reductase (glutaredoxin) [Alphaproteobacteria bacterium]